MKGKQKHKILFRRLSAFYQIVCSKNLLKSLELPLLSQVTRTDFVQKPVALTTCNKCIRMGEIPPQKQVWFRNDGFHGRMSIWQIEIVGQFGDGTPSQCGHFFCESSQCGEFTRMVSWHKKFLGWGGRKTPYFLSIDSLPHDLTHLPTLKLCYLYLHLL